MFYFFILLSKGANSLNERKGQGSIARGIVNLTGRWAKKRREKMKRKNKTGQQGSGTPKGRNRINRV